MPPVRLRIRAAIGSSTNRQLSHPVTAQTMQPSPTIASRPYAPRAAIGAVAAAKAPSTKLCVR